MAEPYNFPKLLREIIGNPLKELGFVQRRCSFSRGNSLFKEKVYFTRDGFKNKGFMIFLIINQNHKDVLGFNLSSLMGNMYYKYNSEEELKQVLAFALADIIDTGIPFFSNKRNELS
ncbi:MAG: hypothetical protein FWG77_03845 [Treponema sp.]|nr:hypothetical protein [Treponema sp.]